MQISIGLNKSLPYNSIIYLDDDNIIDENDSTMVIIKGNENNQAEIIGNNITAEKLLMRESLWLMLC